jgi:trehalose 6-phosphate synthase
VSRVIAVSNRVQVPREGQAAGGLAVGVLAALEDQGGVWFGWSGNEAESERMEPLVVQDGNVSYVTLDLTGPEIDLYYNGFCNGALWPVLHYLLGFLKFDRTHFQAYLRVNARFAQALTTRLEPDDVIWVHDFHMIPLASELRRRGVENRVGFFLHTPFPDYDVMRALPVHRELLRAMCAYDVVGFQTEFDRRSFEQCLRESGIGDAAGGDRRKNATPPRPVTRALPIGIDVDECVRGAEREAATARANVVTSYQERDLVLGVDRLDYSKGLSRRFRAFERFLDRYPERRGTLVYMQVAPPTRQGVRAYDEIRQELEQQAGNINGLYSDVDWIPIHYLNQSFPRGELMGIMRTARVGLVTPIRDGMNLVAKEFVAAQDPADPGVLVLSELAGAAAQLDAAVLVNPYDVDGVADGIHEALKMHVEERRNRHTHLMDVLRRTDISWWRSSYMELLRGAPSPVIEVGGDASRPGPGAPGKAARA